MPMTSDLFLLDGVPPICKCQAGGNNWLESIIQLLGGAETSWQLVQRIGNITTLSPISVKTELPEINLPCFFL